MANADIVQHEEYSRIAAAAARLFQDGFAVRARTTVYRAARPEYSNLPELISGIGSKLDGSRWNPPGALRVLHASDAPEHAISEMLANYRRFSLPLPSGLHIVVRAIHCEISAMLDLRDGAVRHALRVSEDRMLGADWLRENRDGREAVSQAVGRAAADAGFAGVLAHSAAVTSATNTVVFVERLARGDRIAAGDAE